MNAIGIKFNYESPQDKGKTITISIEADVDVDEKLTYKYILGYEGKWNTLCDYTSKNSINWTPDVNGKYLIMVQAKKEGSKKTFDYIVKQEYIIGKMNDKLISGIYLDKEIFSIGEKLSVTVETNSNPVVFRYWLKDENGCQLVKDFSADNFLSISCKKPGKKQIVVECKKINSQKNFDDSGKVQFQVEEIKKVEIKNFKCLSNEMLVDSELVFQVEANYEDTRMILYRFVKIDSEGNTECLQEYSTKKMVYFAESKPGIYKILCLAKDMYSVKEYDDRAVINYKIRPYNSIIIKNLMTDLSSPQNTDTNVEIKALVTGGKNLLYRYIIDGNFSEDSLYIKNSTYIWQTKNPGSYKITLWVKDASYDGNYEERTDIKFEVDDTSFESVKITDVTINKNGRILLGEPVDVKAFAQGGTQLYYSFTTKKDNKIVDKIDYSPNDSMTFVPKDVGAYEMEILSKDKYSKRIYDSHYIVFFEVSEYLPAIIDYILVPPRDNYIIGEKININVIITNTKENLLKYILYINNHKVEETAYIENKKYALIPQYEGKYSVEVYAKNKNSRDRFDCKRKINIDVKEALPVTNTKIKANKVDVRRSEPVMFMVDNEGGNSVMYEFYVMENEEWNVVQKYSRKDNYSFIPFIPGNYKILALCKNQYSINFYDDYDIMEFEVK